MAEIGVLGVAALILLRAIWARNEAALMLGVSIYAGVAFFIVKVSPELIVAVMILAIALATLGLVRFLSERLSAGSAKRAEPQGFFTEV